MNEYEYEEIRGLPGRLPKGEAILWQGAPDWRVLARRTFHVRTIAIYFAVLIGIRGLIAVAREGATLFEAIGAALFALPIALVGLAILAGLAWWHARTTVYTVTDRRVVMRFGVAVQLAVNLPFNEIGGAALLQLPGGYGELPLTLTGNGRLAYLHMWPHARPGRFRDPEPMLRCIPEAAEVAQLLTKAWSEAREDASIEVAGPSIEAPARPRNAAAVAAAPAGATG